MCAALGVKSAQQIVSAIYAPDVTRARIAALAPAVLAACAEAPLNAEIILLPAGRALADTVAAVARALGWQSGPLPLAAAGSFLLSAENVRQEMTRALSARGYDVMLTPVKEPARGALILAEAALMFDRHREKNQTE
jgi:N-acetylglucosamine kinase-like BadF-type ATPase